MQVLLIPDLWDHLIWHDAFILGQTCRLAKKALNQYRPTVEKRVFLFERAHQLCDFDLGYGQYLLGHFSKAIDQEPQFRYSSSWHERIEGSVRLIRKDKRCLKSIKFYPTQELVVKVIIGGRLVVEYNYFDPIVGNRPLPIGGDAIVDQLFNRPLPIGGVYGASLEKIEINTNCPVEIEYVNLEFVKPCKRCYFMEHRIDLWCNHCQVYLVTSEFRRSTMFILTKGMMTP